MEKDNAIVVPFMKLVQYVVKTTEILTQEQAESAIVALENGENGKLDMHIFIEKAENRPMNRQERRSYKKDPLSYPLHGGMKGTDRTNRT